MKHVILSADSTCDLSPELKQRYDVQYYPFHIIYRDTSYTDNVDIKPEDLYEGYYEDKSLPQTAAINVQEYLDHFRPFVEAGCEVIHLNLGGALSSAYENACKAAEQLSGVYPIDSRNLSTGIGQLVIRAGRMIEEGRSAEEVAREIGMMRSRVHSSFVLDTLDFMAAGGRCPQVVAHVGKMVSFKPEILVDNKSGSMGIGRIYRGKLKKVLPRYVEDTLARFTDIVCDDLFITHSGVASELIELVRSEVLSRLPVENIHVTQASCTISSHCGPNTLGILFVTEH
ncbi:DegV family protein [Raoultibacter phocaeensis]|uniref:DegV family protein n=1 Tax=Raoultibacter phocaeensis TaxID=2479841 RepID=UPI001119BFBE|nr:DegV family protein [Raoultibacter phocaeensis]